MELKLKDLSIEDKQLMNIIHKLLELLSKNNTTLETALNKLILKKITT